MPRTILQISMIALCLIVQSFRPSFVNAEDMEPTVQAAGSVTSMIATAISLPLKVATCGVTIALGGVGYGLTLGHSEFIQTELLSSLSSVCGTRLDTETVQVDGPQPSDMSR
jgi:hypothetical protein